MSDVDVIGGTRSAVASRRQATDTGRVLQLLLASIWVVDGLLQLQPFMFSRAFGNQMLAGTAAGNPSPIAHSITWADLVVGHHSVMADIAFALVQLVIGFAIAWRPLVKVALAGSIVWSCLVWWFGEGLGGLLSGSANPVTGAPGAVLLYAVLALVVWPTDQASTTSSSVAARAVGQRLARGLWVVLWGLLGWVAVEGANRSPRGLSRLLGNMAIGEPRWLAGVDHRLSAVVADRGFGVSVALAIVFAAIALGVFLAPGGVRAITAVAVMVGAGIWVLGENFGAIFSGSGTDPNSGPLLMLIAVAYRPPRLGVAGEAPGAVGGAAP